MTAPRTFSFGTAYSATVLASACLFSTLVPTPVHAAPPPPAGTAVLLAAPRCAGTAEAAVRGIVGGGGQDGMAMLPQGPTRAGALGSSDRAAMSPDAETASAERGFRVHDLVVDPVLRRAYVRVADCRDPSRPLTLVPLGLPVGSASGGVPAAVASAGLPAPGMMPVPRLASSATASYDPAATPQPTPTAGLFTAQAAPTLLIARGSSVEVVFQSATIHMVLHGRTTADAPAAGQPVHVALDTEPGTPPRLISGFAVSATRVEVRP